MKLFHKFRAKPQRDGDGKFFASKAELAYYKKLKRAQEDGALLFFLRQVPIELPGNTKYVCDFLEFWNTGEVVFVDVKGHETENFKLKKRMVEELYPFNLQIVK